MKKSSDYIDIVGLLGLFIEDKAIGICLWDLVKNALMAKGYMKSTYDNWI